MKRLLTLAMFGLIVLAAGFCAKETTEALEKLL